jgi:hypothetical protein
LLLPPEDALLPPEDALPHVDIVAAHSTQVVDLVCEVCFPHANVEFPFFQETPYFFL